VSYCQTCGIYKYSHHTCPPSWTVWIPDQENEDDNRLIYAHDAEEAATKYAELYDQEDHGMLGGETIEVHVKGTEVPKEGEQTWRFEVTGEAIPEYTAHELEEE